jgi:hypothetical protein
MLNQENYSPREVVDVLKTLKDKDEIISFLKHWDNTYLRRYIKLIFDKSVKINLPEIPNYRPSENPNGLEEDSLWWESNLFYLFIDDNRQKTESELKREEANRKNVLLRALSLLSAEDGIFYINVLSKSIILPNVTKEILDEVFPGLIVEYDYERHLNKKEKNVELL